MEIDTTSDGLRPDRSEGWTKRKKFRTCTEPRYRFAAGWFDVKLMDLDALTAWLSSLCLLDQVVACD